MSAVFIVRAQVVDPSVQDFDGAWGENVVREIGS